MTETTFPFETAEADSLEADLGPTGKNRQRTFLVLGLVAAVLVAAVGAYFLLFSGADSTDSSLPVKPGTPSGSTGGSAGAKHHKAKHHLPKISARNFGNDPFESQLDAAPIVVTDTGTGTAATGTTGTTATTGTTGTTGTTTGTTGGTTTGATTPGQPVSVRLLSVSADNTAGRVVVDGKRYPVAVGDVFATYFTSLRYKNGRCGTFQFGDEQFGLCEGETSTMQ